jgi:two-component system nitrogen regulation sensor histidine kinase NtrY
MKISFRFTIVILFIVLFGISSILLNNYFKKQQETVAAAFDNIQFHESLAELRFQTKDDSLKAHELINRYGQSLAGIKMNMNETQIYSSLLLLFILTFAIIIFIGLFNLILSPFNKLINATNEIRNGKFNIKLPEKGFKEIKHLNQAFNKMSNELDSTQKKLIESEKLAIWKEIARMLAHEIKNPLTPINLSIQRLEERYISNPESLLEIFPETSETIQQEIRNLQNLARSFSDFARINEPNQTIINIYEEITSIIQSYKYQYDISLSCKKDLEIYFDPTHFYQIITNLLQNSFDACAHDCKVEINVKEFEDTIHIFIIDNGKGINADNLKKIFQPYFSGKKKGTGLGLAVVKRLIDINKAEIKVESKIGEGTKFSIICRKHCG